MIDIDHGASELQRVWERHGQSRWGYGVAVSVRDLEQRVAALEKLLPNSCEEPDAKRGVSDTASPGDVWRLLEPGEVIREGDEFFAGGVWKLATAAGHRPWPYMTYRRRKTAPPCVETDGPASRKCVPPTADIGSGEGSPLGVPQADNAQATGGRGQNTPQPHSTHGVCSDPVGYAVVLPSGRIYTRCACEWDAQAIADALPVAEGVQATVAGLYLSRPEPFSGSGKSGNAGKPTAWLAAEIEMLRFAIRRLADQDATLSVCDGTVTVTVQVDGTLTDEEREAITNAVETLERWQQAGGYHSAVSDDAEVLRGLLKRLG